MLFHTCEYLAAALFYLDRLFLLKSAINPKRFKNSGLSNLCVSIITNVASVTNVTKVTGVTNITKVTSVTNVTNITHVTNVTNVVLQELRLKASETPILRAHPPPSSPTSSSSRRRRRRRRRRRERSFCLLSSCVSRWSDASGRACVCWTSSWTTTRRRRRKVLWILFTYPLNKSLYQHEKNILCCDRAKKNTSFYNGET